MSELLKLYNEERLAVHQAKELTPHLDVVDGASLMTTKFDELRQPVKGLVVEGLTLLCGGSKLGKSWLVLSMCCAVASGKLFLGKSTEQGEVLYLALEDSKRRLQKRLEKLGCVVPAALKVAVNAPTVDGGLINLLEGWVTSANNPQMIVIDTLAKVRDGSVSSKGNMYQNEYDGMGQLKRFADRNHIALVLVHHLNKQKDASDPYERISGSNALMGAADTTMLLFRERNSNDARLSFVGRDVWGDDILLRMNDGKWSVISEEAAARERYENDKVVHLCRALVQESFGKQVQITTQAFIDAGVQRYREQLASSTGEMNKRLQELAPMLSEYDGISLDMGKKVGTARGFWIRKVGA